MNKSSHWVTLLVLFTLASFLEIVVLGQFLAFTPIFLQDLGFDEQAIRAWTGPLASAGFLVGIWFVPFWGVLADKYGRKPLIFRSYLIEAIAVLIATFASNVWLFLLARMLLGLALGNTGLMMAMITDAAPRTRVGFALSLISGVLPLGGVIGSLLGGWLIPQIGIRGLFGVNTILSAVISIALLIGYREAPRVVEIKPIQQMLGDALNAIRHTRLVMTLFIFSFIYTAGYFFAYPYVSVRVTELSGGTNDAPAIGFVLGIAGIATFLTTPLWGALGDRFGHRRILQLLVISMIIFWIPPFFASDVNQMAIAMALIGAASPAILSMVNALIGLYTPGEKRAAVMSMIFLPLNIGFLVAPTLASFVATVQVRDVFPVSAGITLLATVFLFWRRGEMKKLARHQPTPNQTP